MSSSRMASRALRVNVLRHASTKAAASAVRPNVASRRGLSVTAAALRDATKLTSNSPRPHYEKIRGQQKVFATAEEAVADIQSGSTILSAGFGLCGVAETIIRAISQKTDLKDLTGVSNNAGAGAGGLAHLVTSGAMNRVIISYLGNNKDLEQRYIDGRMSIELCPQGTLAERLRAGGAGIPGFYTPTGSNTPLEHGDIPIQHGQDSNGKTIIQQPGNKREVKEFNGKKYLLEEAIKGDVGILRAHVADKAGNCVLKGTTRAFGPLMARAATLTIVEADKIVEVGEIDPNDVTIPGIYVDRVCPAVEPRAVEIMSLRKDENAEPEPLTPAKERRERIASRAAKELKDGFYVNLGVGMPTLVPSFLPKGVSVSIHTENGALGVGPYPTKEEVNPDLINAGKEVVTLLPGASVFDSVESFSMIRGGHIDCSMLGALQVSAAGDLANFMIPGKVVKGMGGAMDLVSNPDETKIVVLTDHVDKNGRPKIVQQCSLPLTGARVASKIITDLAVFDVDRQAGKLTLIETMPGVTVEEIKAKTDATFDVSPDLKEV